MGLDLFVYNILDLGVNVKIVLLRSFQWSVNSMLDFSRISKMRAWDD